MTTADERREQTRTPKTTFSWRRALYRAGFWFVGMLIWFILSDYLLGESQTSLVQAIRNFNWLFAPVHAGMSLLYGAALEAFLAWAARREARKRETRPKKQQGN